MSEHTTNLYTYGVFRLLRMHHFPPLDDIREQHIMEFLASVGDRATAKVHYARGIRSLMHFLKRRDLIAEDPATDLQLRKPRRPKPVALMEEELFRYFMAAWHRGGPRRAWTLVATFGVGARRMEITDVEPNDVDFDGDRVHLRHCKYGKERWVELSPIARTALHELRPWWNGKVLGGIRPATITEWAHQAAVDAGLYQKVRRRPAHVLRASFISHLLDKGVSVVVVKELVGHENIATTSEYAAVLDEDRRRRDGVARLRLAG